MTVQKTVNIKHNKPFRNELTNKTKERRHLLRENKRFLTAYDVMKMPEVSLSYAYKLIRRLNAELESEGFASEGKGNTE